MTTTIIAPITLITENDPLISAICGVASMLMIGQVNHKKTILKALQLRHPLITEEILNKAIAICKAHTVVTDVDNDVVYQTLTMFAYSNKDILEWPHLSERIKQLQQQAN